MFKVGDAVRVKAGSPVWYRDEPIFSNDKGPVGSAIGKKLVIKQCGIPLIVLSPNAETSYVAEKYLEPWNDSEEWDGEKWVPKKLADEITINGVTYIRKPVEKTKAEKIEQHFLDGVGEYEIFDGNDGQEVARATIVSVSRTGNRITVVYDAGE